jgi:hypothetical protein
MRGTRNLGRCGPVPRRGDRRACRTVTYDEAIRLYLRAAADTGRIAHLPTRDELNTTEDDDGWWLYNDAGVLAQVRDDCGPLAFSGKGRGGSGRSKRRSST